MARIAMLQDTLIEYMGYMQMAAILKGEGHQVEVFFDDQVRTERLDRDVSAFAPDVVAFSCLTPSREWAIRTAARLKATTGAATIVGNVDCIMSPDSYVEDGAFDLICTGEGEDVMLELAAAVDTGADFASIKGTWSVGPKGVTRNERRAQLVDMGELPIIDRAIYDKYRFFRHSPYLRVYAGRGCPFRCSFCSNTVMTDAYGGPKKYLRKNTPQAFVEHIVELVASRPRKVKRIFIIDEVLWLDRAWLREFLVLYRDRVGIPFTMNFKFNGGVSEDDVRLMAEAGAVAVCVATETGSEARRRDLLNKPVSNAHILEVAGWMHKYGVDFGSSAFFGLPGQTFEGTIEELDFYRKVNPRYLTTTFYQPYPGLKLNDRYDVASAIPAGETFHATFHHDMYLDLPDRVRLVNLKNVYWYLWKFPRLTRPLGWLCRFRLPFLFRLLYLFPFIGYALWAEGISFAQFLTHFRNFMINPILRRNQPMQTQGRPFDIGYGFDQGPEVSSVTTTDPGPPTEAVPVTLEPSRRPRTRT